MQILGVKLSSAGSAPTTEPSCQPALWALSLTFCRLTPFSARPTISWLYKFEDYPVLPFLSQLSHPHEVASNLGKFSSLLESFYIHGPEASHFLPCFMSMVCLYLFWPQHTAIYNVLLSSPLLSPLPPTSHPVTWLKCWHHPSKAFIQSLHPGSSSRHLKGAWTLMTLGLGFPLFPYSS